ncbi:head maturation protease, ClpP-related [Pseudonocardia broussonetiae]|uniref:ATP-dependent Clp protease proteolytic subunit n=1 Tax=Pseudonocardia broussonetiae TaxID=2736640 RepID=A0A6M6JHK1_9PSEU|nr:head maturation protease, ClpP-related [Pseudonocardia broussonetiae]QJY46663.1 peptidase [Pseudonocardia broussonetiae]
MPDRPRLRAAAGAPRPWYRVGPVLALAEGQAATEEAEPGTASSSADVYLFDTIGGWFGVTADAFVRDVATLDVDRIVLHLNSPGGDASEGVTIANMLRAHRAQVEVRVDGLAASAASVIAMAGDEVVMGIGSQLMVHDAWGVAIGNAAEMAQAQRMLDSTSDALASTYAAKAGGTTEQWREVMRAETWYTADEAVAAGLADRVAAADETGTAAGEQITPGGSSGSFWDMWDSLAAPDRFDLSAFTYAGRDRAPAPAMPGRTTPAASAAGRSTTERSGLVPFLDDVRQRLGVAANADETTVLAALEEALDERADGDDEDDDETNTPAQLPEGVEPVDSQALAQLRRDAELGRQAHARQEREDREALVDAAIADGRIAPASRAAWLTNLEADPGTGARDTLASLQKGLIPVGPPVGHNGGAETSVDPLYASIFGSEA